MSSETRISLLADMNISPITVDALRKQGWDIIRVSQKLSLDYAAADYVGSGNRHEQTSERITGFGRRFTARKCRKRG